MSAEKRFLKGAAVLSIGAAAVCCGGPASILAISGEVVDALNALKFSQRGGHNPVPAPRALPAVQPVSMVHNGNHECSGAIINGSTLLTARHCLDHRTAREEAVYTGELVTSEGEFIVDLDRQLCHFDPLLDAAYCPLSEYAFVHECMRLPKEGESVYAEHWPSGEYTQSHFLVGDVSEARELQNPEQLRIASGVYFGPEYVLQGQIPSTPGMTIDTFGPFYSITIPGEEPKVDLYWEGNGLPVYYGSSGAVIQAVEDDCIVGFITHLGEAEAVPSMSVIPESWEGAFPFTRTKNPTTAGGVFEK